MSKRIWVLAILIAIALLTRALDAYEILVRPTSLLEPMGFNFAIENNRMTVISMDSTDPSGQPTRVQEAGLKKNDQILAVYNARGEGQSINSLFDFGQVMRTVGIGEPLTLVVLRDSSQQRSQEVSLHLAQARRSRVGWSLLWGLGVVLPMLSILTAAFIGFLKAEDDNAFLASLLFLCFSSLSIHSYFLFPGGLRVLGMIYEISLGAFLPYLMMRFFLLFPSPSLIDRKMPWLKTVFLACTLVSWIIDLTAVSALCLSFKRSQQLKTLLPHIQQVLLGLTSAMFIIGLLSLVVNTVTSKSKDERRRMVILLAGTLAGLLPFTILIVLFVAFGSEPTSIGWIVLAFCMLAFFPLSFVYVVVKHRVLGIRLILRRGLQYALVSRGFLAVEAILIFLIFNFGLGPIFSKLFSGAGKNLPAVSMALITAGLVIGLRKINKRVMPVIDRRFFREAYNAQQVLTDLRRAVRRLADQPDQLLATVADKISDSLYPDHVAIFLRGFAPALPTVNGQASARALVKADSPQTSPYRSRCIRVRSSNHEESLCAVHGQEGIVLPADSFISHALEGFATREPAALEVYLDDPKSWARALVKAHVQTEERYQERELLQRLNTKLIVPLVANDRVLGFISLGEKLSEEAYSKDDKELLLTVAEQTAIALDYAQLINQVAEQEKLKREIEIAKEVQAQLFPQNLPPFRTLDYTGICQAARGVGGDYYDFLSLGDDKLGIALGDISGKGISAALLMASLQALLRSHAPLRREAVDELVRDINRLLCASTDTSKYGTFFYGLYDDNFRTLTYVNAGHNPPILFRPHKTGVDPSTAQSPAQNSPSSLLLQRAGQGEMKRLETGGTVIGLFPEACYQQETIQMDSGDILLIFSDGVSEAMNSNEEEFGEARLAALLSSNPLLSAGELQDLILSQIAEFVKEAPQHDDLTLVVAKVV